MTNPRILIVRVGAMGDVLHALPAVAALRAALPDARIGWAIDPRWSPLLVSPSLHFPHLDTVHAVNTRQWTARSFLPQLLSLRNRLEHQDYDQAIDLQGNIRSAVIGRLAGAPRITGSATPRETPARYLYTQRVRLTRRNVIDQAAELISAAVGIAIAPIQPTLPADPASEAWANAYAAKPFILIAPTAGWGAKEWPLGNYSALIPLLEALGYRVLLNVTPASAPNLPAEAVPSTLPQLIALTRRAALVIGGDTGPVHLAAALGRPTLALFGPTDPARNGPNFPGARALAIRHPSSRTDHHRTPETDPGLKQITVEQVLKAAVTLLDRQPAAPLPPSG
jgi:heptosyltransferase-1